MARASEARKTGRRRSLSGVYRVAELVDEQPRSQVRRSLLVRTALLSFMLVFISLAIFVFALIPSQRRALLEALSSKAADIATTVGQATATPLLLNDYAAVVEHCLNVVQERPTIRYVVVTRREGASLVHTADSWRQENLSGMWAPGPGTDLSAGRIVASPLVTGQVFHYTHRLTYSGVDCGWIHVGLSLDKFHRDLGNSYRRTLWAALPCVFVGLVASFFFAQRLSKPILTLSQMAATVGRGDLAARARIESGDELEDLATTLNWMAASLQRSQLALLEAWNYADNIIRSMQDCLIVGRSDGTIERVNAAACRLLGYGDHELRDLHVSVVIGDEEAESLVELASRGNTIDREVAMLTMAGDQFPALASAAPMKDEENEVVGFVMIAKDISERKRVEEQVHRSLREKEVLLREVHHRVKNNMQVISSLLKLQSRQVTDSEASSLLRESQSRIWSMSLVHERLYQSENLMKIDFAGYVRTLTAGLCQTFLGRHPERIDVRCDIEAIAFEIDTMIPCGLIITELVTNALKYAFPDQRQGTIVISLHEAKGGYRLSVADDGVGLPADLDFHAAESLGLRLVTMLAEDQLDGTLSVGNDTGTAVSVDFEPLTGERELS